MSGKTSGSKKRGDSPDKAAAGAGAPGASEIEALQTALKEITEMQKRMSAALETTTKTIADLGKALEDQNKALEKATKANATLKDEVEALKKGQEAVLKEIETDKTRHARETSDIKEEIGKVTSERSAAISDFDARIKALEEKDDVPPPLYNIPTEKFKEETHESIIAMNERIAALEASAGAGGGRDTENIDRALLASMQEQLEAMNKRLAKLSTNDSPSSPAPPFLSLTYHSAGTWPDKTAPNPDDYKSKEEASQFKLFQASHDHLKHTGDRLTPTMNPTDVASFLNAVYDFVQNKGALPYDIKRYMSTEIIRLLSQSEAARGNTLATTSTVSREWVMAAANFLAENGLDLSKTLEKTAKWMPTGPAETVTLVNVKTAIIALFANVATAWNSATTAMREDPTNRALVTIVIIETLPTILQTLVKQRLNIKNREDVPHDMTLEKLKEKAFEAAEALFKDSTKTAELHTLVVRNMDTPAILTHKSKSKDGHAARGHKAERADSEKPNCSYCAGQGKTGRALLHQFEKCRQKIKDASAASTHEPPKSHRPSRGDDDDAKSTTSHKSTKGDVAKTEIKPRAGAGGDDKKRAATGCPNCKFDASKPGHSIEKCHIKKCRFASTPDGCKKGDKCPLAASH